MGFYRSKMKPFVMNSNAKLPDEHLRVSVGLIQGGDDGSAAWDQRPAGPPDMESKVRWQFRSASSREYRVEMAWV
jgi:hypothetical protein